MKQIIKLINKVKRVIKLTTSYGKVISNSKGKLKTKFLEGEIYDDTSNIQHYGFKSDVPKYSKVFAVCNGNRDNLTIIGSSNIEKEPQRKGTSIYFDENTFVNLQNGKLKIEANETNILREVRDALDTLDNNIKDLIPYIASASPKKPPPILSDVKGKITKLKKTEG